MEERIKVGDVVRPRHCQRSQFMGADFREWIDCNLDQVFTVESKVDRSCRLTKGRSGRFNRVGFTVTEEFLELA